MSTQDQTRTKSAYGLQWNRYRIIRTEEDRATFRNRTGLDAVDLEDRRVLDAGCGMGRYLRVAGESRAELIVGIDLSEATTAARELTTALPQVSLVRGDLLKPPLRPGSFDHVYSLGVLDHTPDPRAAFLALVPLLKPGGRIVIWLYPRESPVVERVMNWQRAVSTRLPVRLLERLCQVTAPVGALKRRLCASRFWPIERLGVLLHLATIGVSMHPDPEVRVCDTLDWYAPKFLSRHTVAEVTEWFTTAGLVDLENLSEDQEFFHSGQGNGVNLAGRRPGVS
jgi:SAM-dependent methyltransferase